MNSSSASPLVLRREGVWESGSKFSKACRCGGERKRKAWKVGSCLQLFQAEPGERLLARVGGELGCATCLAIVGGGGGTDNVLFTQQPRVKEQRSPSTVCTLVWDWAWIGTWVQVLSHPTFRTNEALRTKLRLALRCCESVTEKGGIRD